MTKRQTLEIPYNKPTQEDLKTHCEIMRKGNVLLRKCAEMAGMEYRKFRMKLFKTHFNPKDYSDLKQPQVVEITRSLPAIQAVRSLEWTMVCGFSQLVRRLADKWASRSNGIISYEDFEQEGFMALIDSIYNYTREDVAFITFAQWAIHRRLMTAANRNNPFCPLTNQALTLMKRYESAKRDAVGPANQEDLIESLGVDEEEAQIIRDCLVMVACPSQNPDEDVTGDYSEYRRGLDRERSEPIPGEYYFRNYDGSVPLGHELRDAIAAADLSALELKVLETFMSPHYGWQEELASQTINHKTQRRYTRQAINVILQSAVKKVKAIYLRQQVA